MSKRGEMNVEENRSVQGSAGTIVSEIRSLNPEAKLIIVTKTQPIEVVEQLFKAGFRDFGENRIPQFVERQARIPEARWHFIGRLQRKHVAKVVGKAELIHSVDSEKLLEKIERSCLAAGGGGAVSTGTRGEATAGDGVTAGGVSQRVLLQVSVSGEGQKQGFHEDELKDLVSSYDFSSIPNVRVEGLMTMAPFVSDESILRHCFVKLRELRDELNDSHGLGWHELSMGMSNDYRIALEEGATIVRIGTAVFEGP